MRVFSWPSLVLALLALSTPALADHYQIDHDHSSIEFKIRHLVSRVKGTFSRFDGAFDYTAANPLNSKFQAKIDATSINTASDDRDRHLKSPDFFDAAKFHDITFESTKIEASSASRDDLKIIGNLTIKGRSCPVTINAHYAGEVKDPWGNTKAGFEGTARINRLAYGLSWNKPLVGDKAPKEALVKDSCDLNNNLDKNNDGAGLTLGTVIDIELHIEAENLTKKPASVPASK